MSIFRLALVMVIAVALLPSDPNARSQLAQKAIHVGQETATFCQRNPHTCAAGQELWTAFVEKAQYALSLSAEFARSYTERVRSEPTAAAPAHVRPHSIPEASGYSPAGVPTGPTITPDSWRRQPSLQPGNPRQPV